MVLRFVALVGGCFLCCAFVVMFFMSACKYDWADQQMCGHLVSCFYLHC